MIAQALEVQYIVYAAVVRLAVWESETKPRI